MFPDGFFPDIQRFFIMCDVCCLVLIIYTDVEITMVTILTQNNVIITNVIYFVNM